MRGTGLSGPEAADEDAFPLTTPALGKRVNSAAKG